MAKLTTSDLATPLVGNSHTTINNNFTAVETAMEKTLSRDGTSPNSMEANLDMNSYRILNLPAPSADQEPLRKTDLASFLTNDIGLATSTLNGLMSNEDKIILDNHFYIEDYGAVCDGVTDDSAAVQAAITAALATTTGGVVVFPGKKIGISTMITVPKNTTKGLILQGQGAATIIQGLGTYSGEYFHIGGAASAGGVRYVVRDMMFGPPVGGTASGIVLENANGIFLKGLYFSGMQTDIDLETSYLVTIEDWFSLNAVFYGVYSAGTCHGLKILKARLYNTGGTTGHAIRLDTASDNIVIKDCDFEYCSVVLKAAGGSSFHVVGNYIEYTVNTEFDFTAAVYGFTFEDNWLALRDGGATSTYNYINGGSFTGNHLYDQVVAWGANVSNLEVGINRLTGTSTLAEAPWVTVSAFSNSYSAGARTPGYHKSRDGTVRLRGELNAGTSNTTAFTLPAGYRPSQAGRFAVNGTGATVAMLIVDTNGNVVPVHSAVTEIQLDGVSFIWDPA